MKILHVIASLDPAGGGPQAVAPRLAAAQALAGQDVSIAAGHLPHRQHAIDVALAKIPGIPRVTIVPVSASCFRLPGAAGPLQTAIAAADIVHLHGVWELLLLQTAAIARRLHKPYIVAPHGMLYPWSLAQKSLKKKIALALGYRKMLNGAAALHALNRDEALAMQPLGLRPPVRIVPNGIFADEIDPLPPQGQFRATLPALGDHPFVLFLSRLHPGKGLDLLARAFARAVVSKPDLHLVVAGPDAGALADFQRVTKETGTASRVHVIGPVYGSQKFAAMVDAACFCLPSHHETFSMAILEALACGLPVAVSNATHFPEIAEVGAGEIVPLESAAIADAILRICENPAARNRMADAGRALVASRFTWPGIAEESIQVYRERGIPHLA